MLSGSQTWSLALRIYTERVSAQIPEANISTSNRGKQLRMEKLQSAQTRVVTLKYQVTTRPNTRNVWYKFIPYIILVMYGISLYHTLLYFLRGKGGLHVPTF